MKKNNITLDYNCIGNFKKPADCFHYTTKIKGTCGQTAISAILGLKTKDVFKKWGVLEKEFRHFTSQKEMKEILLKLGYIAKQKSTKDKLCLPFCDLAIIRVSFGNQNQHYMKIAKNSHYLGLKRMKDNNLYIFDSIQYFDNEQTNGLWIKREEFYLKIMLSEKMFITSYLEITRNGVS